MTTDPEMHDLCPRCKSMNQTAVSTDHNEIYWHCEDCGYEYDENGEPRKPCTHDNIRGRMGVTNKCQWERDPFTGALELVLDVVKESEHEYGHYECDDCGNTIEYSEFQHDPPEGWKPEKQIWIIDTTEIIIRNYRATVMADRETEARLKIENQAHRGEICRKQVGENTVHISTFRATKHTPWIIEQRQRKKESPQPPQKPDSS